MTELKSILEALLFTADRPLTTSELRGFLTKTAEHSEEPTARAWRKVKTEEIDSALRNLAEETAATGHSYRLVCVAGGWQFATLPDYAPWLRALTGERLRPPRLSQPALETLSIIAYRQPITRAEIELIRGVSVDGVMQTLLERGLVEPAGRVDAPGRPMTYVTTKTFLEYFGLTDLTSLPGADELRRLPLERPPGLVTVEPGLATVPPDQLALQTQKPAAQQRDPAQASPQSDPAAASAPATSAPENGTPLPSDNPTAGASQAVPGPSNA